MHQSLLELLADPVTGTRLRLQGAEVNGEEIATGTLVADSGATYPIRDGIPRFVLTKDERQLQTANGFGYQWQRRDYYDSQEFRTVITEFITGRYGFASAADMRAFFAQHPLMLDAGCGGGASASTWLSPDWQTESGAQWLGADISEAVDVAKERVGTIPGTRFVQADVFQMPFAPATFDLVWSEGVMHHTPSTRTALNRLNRLLKPGGHMMFYVYKKKAVLREFTDDYIRQAISEMTPEDAWEALRPLTRLGQALSALKVDVDVPEDIPLLGIKAGKLDIQRFIYWNIAKLYWRDTFKFEENNHVNFDWYHPPYAHRHTPEEVTQWCQEENLKIERLDIQDAGITVLATKAA